MTQNTIKIALARHANAHHIADNTPFYRTFEDAETDGKTIPGDLRMIIPGSRACNAYRRKIRGRDIQQLARQMYTSLLALIALDEEVIGYQNQGIQLYVLAPDFQEAQEGLAYFARSATNKRKFCGIGLNTLSTKINYRHAHLALSFPFLLIPETEIPPPQNPA